MSKISNDFILEVEKSNQKGSRKFIFFYWKKYSLRIKSPFKKMLVQLPSTT